MNDFVLLKLLLEQEGGRVMEKEGRLSDRAGLCIPQFLLVDETAPLLSEAIEAIASFRVWPWVMFIF